MREKTFGLSFDGLIFIIAIAANFLMATYLSTFSVLGFINTLDQRWVLIFGVITFPILFAGILGDLFRNKGMLWGALFLAIILLIIIPTIVSMYLRQTSKPYLFVHDNPIQIEESIKFLLSGKNPYTEDYFQTPMSDWQYGPPIFSYVLPVRPPESYFINPALYHHVSLPFGFLSVIPFYIIWNNIFGFFDARIFYLPAYIIVLVLAVRLVSKTSRFAFLALFSLNPYFVLATLEGHNDILVTLLIIIGLILASKQKYLLSAIPLALAVATKQSAWVFILIYLIYLFFKLKDKYKTLIKQFLGIVILTSGLLFLPFLAWDFKSFIEDTLLYVGGGLSTSYPIAGNGFSAFLLAVGVIKTSLAYYPAWIFEIVFGLPTLALCTYLLKKSPTIKMLILSYSLLLFVIIFFSRFFLTSYFGVLLQFLILGYFVSDSEASKHAG